MSDSGSSKKDKGFLGYLKSVGKKKPTSGSVGGPNMSMSSTGTDPNVNATMSNVSPAPNQEFVP